MAKTITNVMEWAGLRRKEPAPEMSRSQYSLVSCGDLSPAAVELWLGLPEEVKYDPALAPFRRYYEKDRASKHGPSRKTSQIHMKHPRLPSVNSAPLLNNNEHRLHVTPSGGATDTGKDLEIPKWKEPIPENEPEPIPRMSRMTRAHLYIKLSLLLAIWMFFTIVFMMYNEKEEPNRQSSIAPGQTKDYTLYYSAPDFAVLVKATGPFISDQKESGMSSAQKDAEQKMYVWLERRALDGSTVISTQASKPWSVILEKETLLDFAVGETRSQVLRVEEPPSTSAGSTVYVIRMNTTSPSTAPLSISYFPNPLDQKTGVILSCVLLVGLYVLIISEVINRTMAALVISTLSLAVLSLVGERPSLEELVSWLDMETLLLLFSMMLLVAIMAETGMFDYLAVFTFQVTKGELWPLINLLCVITAICSTVLDNVTTVLLMTPVTIRLCEVTELDPVPILIAMVLYSNIGGTATPVGDPPNVIIASNKLVVDSGINFANFTLHMTLGSLLVCVQTYFQLKYIYRDTNKLRLSVPKEIQELRQQIAIWRRASESLPHMSKDEQVVREQLDRKVKKLNSQLEIKVQESTKCACPREDFDKMLDEMKATYKIRDKTLLIKSLVAIGFVVTVFFLHSIPDLKRVSLGWTALLGALLLLILADREDLEPILHRVEWSTLLFFAALFVLMEALSKLGLIAFIGGLTESLILSVHESGRLAVALLLMLWVSGVTSAFVDNIPLTSMMIRIVTSLGTNPNLGLPMAPLIWALSFGACMGGNGTLIGASANVVCAGVAEQHGYRISFMRFFKVGFPIMIGHLVVVTCYLLLFHCVIAWH